MQADKMLATLKRYAPSRVRAFVGDEQRDIAVPTRRKKWTQVISTIDGLGAWTRVELLDKQGALLHSIENTEPAADLVELQSGKSAEVQAMVNIVVRAQRDAMQFRDAEVQGLIRAQAEVVRELTNGVRALSTLYQEQVAAVRESAAMRLEAMAEAGSDGPLGQMLEAMLPQLLPAILPKILGAGMSPSDRPKNGA